MLFPKISIVVVIPLLNKRSLLSASIIISNVLVEVSAEGDMKVISPIFVIELELITLAFFSNLNFIYLRF